MPNRTLTAIAGELTSTKLYLAQVEPGAVTQSQTEQIVSEHEQIGLRPYPTENPDRRKVILYRVLGFHRDRLDSKSTLLIATHLIPTELFPYEGDQVGSLLIPHGDRVPYVKVTYGSSVVEDFAPRQPAQPLGERTYLVLANHTGRDFHIQVTGDVHTGNWEPDNPPLKHNEEPELKSEKINFGNEATYVINIWKNDNGRRGEQIGEEFKAQVRYNAAGNRDHLEFIIVDFQGKTYLQVWSVRKAIEIALYLWLL